MPSVKLVSVSKPLIEGLKTGEDLIVYCARVSNPSNQLNLETGEKLLKYCVKHGHWSIFDQAGMTIEIKTSRAIAAQILRHWSFKFQEFSQRYSKVSGEFEPIELRLQGATNRQVGEDVLVDLELSKEIEEHEKASMALYNKIIDRGVATECARFVLPLNIQTTLYIKGTCRSWMHYFDQRCKNNTQKEHRDVALQAREIFKEQFPIVSKAKGYFDEISV